MRTLRFYGFFSVCVCVGDFEILRFFPLCVGTSMGFYDFFPVDGDFEILLFFSLCVGPLCLWTLRFYVFLPVCAAPVLETLKIFKKKSPIWKNPGCGDLKWQ